MVLGIVRAGSLVMGETRALHGNLMSSVFPTIQLAFHIILLFPFFLFLLLSFLPSSPHDMTIVVVITVVVVVVVVARRTGTENIKKERFTKPTL